MKALFDTNILIDYLNGIQQARQELDLYDKREISIITWMEVMAGTSQADETPVRQFLNNFTKITVSETIAEKAVIIRKQQKIKLPDAIIWASAITNDALFVTRNTNDFPKISPGIRVPYSL